MKDLTPIIQSDNIMPPWAIIIKWGELGNYRLYLRAQGISMFLTLTQILPSIGWIRQSELAKNISHDYPSFAQYTNNLTAPTTSQCLKPYSTNNLKVPTASQHLQHHSTSSSTASTTLQRLWSHRVYNLTVHTTLQHIQPQSIYNITASTTSQHLPRYSSYNLVELIVQYSLVSFALQM